MTRIVLLFFSSLCSVMTVANAHSFNVVALRSLIKDGITIPTDIGVEIVTQDTSTVHTMQPYYAEQPHPILHHVDINANLKSRQPVRFLKYRYVLLDPRTKATLDTESFYRTLTTESTLNEIYGRPNTVDTSLASFSPATDSSLFPMGFDRTDKLHRMNEVVTLQLHASPEQVKRMHDNYIDESEIDANMTWISSDDVRHFKSCSFAIGGRSTKQFTKLPYKITLRKKDRLGGLRKLKLRSTGSDPSYIREKLVYDLHRAVGRPSSLASFVRVFINDQPAGLFLLAEKYDKNWLYEEFHQGNKAVTGTLYKAEGAVVKEKYYADLSYHRKDLEYYDALYTMVEKPKGKDGMEGLVAFTQFINDQLQWQETHQAELDSSMVLWENRFNVKGFLANMALEFLVGTWDNYIQNAQNYYLYEHPTTDADEEDDNKTVNPGMMDWVAWDFDYSMGNGPILMDSLTTGDYHNFSGMLTRPLTRAVLSIPTYRRLFESQIRYITDHYFAPHISTPIIDAWISFLGPDMRWDATLPRLRAGHSFPSIYESVIRAQTDPTQMGNGAEGLIESGEMSVPASFDLATGIDFVLRVNENVTLDQAIDGPTNFKSLLAVKEFIQRKVDNVNMALSK